MTNLLDLITPTNLESEREKFFASSIYNPTFHYIWQDNTLNPKFNIKLKSALWDAIRTQDNYGIVDAAKQLFEVEITPSLVTVANQVAREKGKISTGTVSEILTLFQEAFDYFQVKYSVELIANPGFNIRPQHENKKLLISDNIHFEYFSMEAEVSHELVHIIRYMNGKHNSIKRSERFLPTEEGLASWCQDHTNDDNGLAQHAIEYVASSVGLDGSLRDIFDCMCELGMSKELAWKRACRHKFGFVDTKLAGDILKPAMYYANEVKIDTLTTDQKLRLFVGKINLDELSNYPIYTGIWSATQLTNYFKL